MESRINYSVVGLFVLILFAAGLVTAWWLYTGGSARQYTPYVVYATDSVTGLNSNSNVYYNGVDVGYVDAIRIDRENPEKIRIDVMIESTVPIRSDTTARLQLQGVTGLSVLNLKGGAVGERLKAAEGQCCPEIPYEPSLFSKLEGGINEAMVQVVNISERFDRVFSEENLVALEQTLTNLNQLSTALAEEREQLQALVRNASRTAENTAEMTAGGAELVSRAQSTLDALDRAIIRVSGTMDTFEAAADDVAQATEATVRFSSAGEQAAEEISRQTLPDISLLIRDVRELSRRLSAFTSTLDEDPSRVFFGGTERPPGPGEER
ncbi:MlaD family protein [Guyparkeria sp.]|uniref:MlaD family protein n=1 Tax=Guyparkeria sp. TaxID=2035736 RepID=UPI003564E5D2